MEIKLSPEMEAVVASDMASGRYASVDEYVAEAVAVLHERQQWRTESLEDQRQGIEAAWLEAERGELMPLEDFRDEMQTMKADWAKDRKRA